MAGLLGSLLAHAALFVHLAGAEHYKGPDIAVVRYENTDNDFAIGVFNSLAYKSDKDANVHGKVWVRRGHPSRLMCCPRSCHAVVHLHQRHEHDCGVER